MEKFLNILEAPRPQQQQNDFDEEKTRYISSKISIWGFYGIPQATYLNYPVEEKSKMFRDYIISSVKNITGRQVEIIFCLV